MDSAIGLFLPRFAAFSVSRITDALDVHCTVLGNQEHGPMLPAPQSVVVTAIEGESVTVECFTENASEHDVQVNHGSRAHFD